MELQKEEDQLKRESAEAVRDLKASVLTDPANAALFRRKARECAKKIPWLRESIIILTPLGGSSRLLRDYWLDRNKNALARARSDKERFTLYAKWCSGKKDYQKDKINIEQAKLYPIKDLLADNPTSRSSDRSMYLCPLHREDTASFVVYTKQNTWHCFGCGEGNDSIDLVMKTRSLSFVEAVKSLTG